MDKSKLKKLLQEFKGGKQSLEGVLEGLRDLPFEDLTIANVDHHRHLRQGIPEVIYAEGKETADIITIAKAMYKKSKRLLITRTSEEVKKKLRIKSAIYHKRSKLIAIGEPLELKGNVLVISAGTSDIPIAEEAALTAQFMGSKTTMLFDVGVAGIHRLMDRRSLMHEANAIIVVAGMEGALPSVVGGLTDKPIVAVPTSVGYGTSFSGLTALFAMLNSCVPGIAVMNIDNGFGAGCLAHKINISSTNK
jgi:NCAIR mutase (PurE)-related protein